MNAEVTSRFGGFASRGVFLDVGGICRFRVNCAYRGFLEFTVARIGRCRRNLDFKEIGGCNGGRCLWSSGGRVLWSSGGRGEDPKTPGNF